MEHPALLDVLATYQNVDGPTTDLVFPVTLGGPDKSPAWNYIKVFGRLKKKMKMPDDVTLYSARKSFITTALDLGISVVEIERYVGHKVDRLVLGVYSQGRGEKALRDLASRFQFERYIEAALTEGPK